MAQTTKNAVSGHDACHRGSASVCDGLFEALRQRIPGLSRHQTETWCAFYPPERPCFVQITHRKRQPRLDVWFLSDGPGPPQCPGLEIRERAPTSGGFGKNFKWHFFLDDARMVQRVSRFLIESAGLMPTGGENRLPTDFPDEVCAAGLYEGAVKHVTVNAYERNQEARQQCIESYGKLCCVCGEDLNAVYGPLAQEFIHVHHLKPLAEIGEKYTVDPIADLRPVCPNCHAIIHLGGVCRTIEEARGLVDPRVPAFWASFATLPSPG